MRNGAGRTLPRLLGLFAGLCLAFPAAAPAVTDEEVFRDFRFNLINPGARSLGIGGAFIAVADDATAALANPAGLTLLARPEFFTEVRDNKTDDSSIEQQFTAANIQSGTQPRAVFSPSFVSYVHPWKRFAVGVSRVELNKTSNSTANSFTLDVDPNIPGLDFQFRGAGRIETELSVWNVSGAFKATDKISVGATVAVGLLDIRSSVNNVFVDNTGFVIDPNLVGSAALTIYDTSIDDKDTDVTFNAGVHVRFSPKFSAGAVYRGGLKFEVAESIANESVLAFLFGGTITGFTGNPFTTTFNTPESFGVGVSWRPANALTISLDGVRINYTDLLDGFQPGVNVLTLFDQNANFTVDDATEVHLGGEYVFTAGTIPWAVRVGAFTDHNSRLFADFRSGRSTFSTDDTFPERDNEIHYTVGTGVVVKERFQIDAAADISDIANEYVLSTIFRF